MLDVTNWIENEEYFKPEELAKKFKISLSSVYNLIRKGEIPSVRLGKVYRIPASGLELHLRPAKQKRAAPKVTEHFLKKLRSSQMKDQLREVWLFGSYARGDNNPNSDVDLLVITNRNRLKTSLAITQIAEEAMEAVAYEDIISLTEFSEEEWEIMKKDNYLLAQTIQTEGILLWKIQ